MDLSPEEKEIKQALDKYLKQSGFIYFPDEKHVLKIIRKLAEKKKQTGLPYCPCRLVTGDQKTDKNIICPCAYHIKEIQEQGHCCCRLFAANGFSINNNFNKGGKS